MKIKALENCNAGDVVYLRPDHSKYEDNEFAIVLDVIRDPRADEAVPAALWTHLHGACEVGGAIAIVARIWYGEDAKSAPMIGIGSDPSEALILPGYTCVEHVSIETAGKAIGVWADRVARLCREVKEIDGFTLSATLSQFARGKYANNGTIEHTHSGAGSLPAPVALRRCKDENGETPALVRVVYGDTLRDVLTRDAEGDNDAIDQSINEIAAERASSTPPSFVTPTIVAPLPPPLATDLDVEHVDEDAPADDADDDESYPDKTAADGERDGMKAAADAADQGDAWIGDVDQWIALLDLKPAIEWARQVILLNDGEKIPEPLYLIGAQACGKTTLVKSLSRVIGRDLNESEGQQHETADVVSTNDLSATKAGPHFVLFPETEPGVSDNFDLAPVFKEPAARDYLTDRLKAMIDGEPEHDSSERDDPTPEDPPVEDPAASADQPAWTRD